MADKNDDTNAETEYIDTVPEDTDVRVSTKAAGSGYDQETGAFV